MGDYEALERSTQQNLQMIDWTLEMAENDHWNDDRSGIAALQVLRVLVDKAQDDFWQLIDPDF